MPTDLPDVNVWLALVDEHHPHHGRARRYWDDEAAPRIGFCRVTMLGLLRIATHPAAMRGQPFTAFEIWEAYRRFLGLPEVCFLDERSGIDAEMTDWSTLPDFPQRAWTDCYIAAFARVHRARLVTFDRGFSRFDGLDLLQLIG
jgi:uncharacterized protein